MKKHIAKISAFALCLSTLLSVLVSSVCATAPLDKNTSYTAIEWEIDKNGSYIFGNDVRYDIFSAGGRFYIDQKTRFHFSNTVLWDGEIRQIYGESASPHLVMVTVENGNLNVYADLEGKKILNDFITRKNCRYYLESRNTPVNQLAVDSAFVSTLDTLYKTQSDMKENVDLSLLNHSHVLEIVGHDPTETLGYKHGAIFRLSDGAYYYVCMEKLDRSVYFDSFGNFLYNKSISVPALLLDYQTCKTVDEKAESMTRKKWNNVYESDIILGKVDVNGNRLDDYVDDYTKKRETRQINAAIGFIVLIIVFGLALPLPFFVLGLVLAKKNKLWCGASVWAAIWFASALSYLVFLLVFSFT